jgi:excisionase family DNA binding protein
MNSVAYFFLNLAIGGFSMTQLLTVNEIAEELKVHKSWVYGKSRETGPDAMPRLKVGKYLRFERDKVLEWLRNRNDSDNGGH